MKGALAARVSWVLAMCAAGAVASGFVAMVLWEDLRNSPSSQCCGLATSAEIGTAFWTMPFSAIEHFSDPIGGALLCVAPAFVPMIAGIALGLGGHRWMAAALIAASAIAYGLVSCAFVSVGC